MDQREKENRRMLEPIERLHTLIAAVQARELNRGQALSHYLDQAIEVGQKIKKLQAEMDEGAKNLIKLHTISDSKEIRKKDTHFIEELENTF